MDPEQNLSKEELEAAFVENYFDCVEELPNDVQKKLTRMRELDICHREIEKNLQIVAQMFESDESESDKAWESLLQMEKLLISLDEVGEEKCEVSQSITDLVDEKVRLTEELAKNLESSEAASDESTEPLEETLAEIETSLKRKYCICEKEPKEGEMFMCDNEICPVEWFHFACVELKSKPKRRKWFCPLCRGKDSNVMKPEEM